MVPSASWRIWTSFAHYPALPKNVWRRLGGGGSGQGRPEHGQSLIGVLLTKVLVPGRHGENGNAFSEILGFSRQGWIKLFEDISWEDIS